MKLYFLKEDALYQLKSNTEYNEKNYSSDSNDWVYDYFGKDYDPFLEFKHEIPDFEMFMDSDHPEGTDARNAQILYTALKDITNSQATDERLWSGLAHGQLWKYMQYRLKTSSRNLNSESIKSNFFFKQGPNRSLIVNTLSRLWWVAKQTYDENNTENPFHLMRFFEKDLPGKTLSIFSRNFTNNPKIIQALLEAMLSLEDHNIKITRAQFLSLVKYVNMLGGVFILDYLSKEELEYKIIKHYKSIYKSKQYAMV